MKILYYLDSLVSDQELTYMILVLTVLFGLIPVISTIKTERILPKKQRRTPVKKKFTASGKWWLCCVVLLIMVGLWKLDRDSKAQSRFDSMQFALNRNIQSLGDSLANWHVMYHEQYKSDTSINNKNIRHFNIIIKNIDSSLRSNNIALDKNYNVIRGQQLLFHNVWFSNTEVAVNTGIINRYPKPKKSSLTRAKQD